MDNNQQEYELTEEGKGRLEKELGHLETVDRIENIEALKDARAQGDLSENADYDAARDEQARIESRIAEIKNILKHAKIIEHLDDDSVNIGKEVVLKFSFEKQEKKYSLVGTLEADPLNGQISNISPVGAAILNKKKGDKVTVKSATNKEFTVEIVDVK